MKLSENQIQQLRTEIQKKLVEAQKAWIYRLIDFSKEEGSSSVFLNETAGLGSIVPCTWNVLFPEVKKQLQKDGYKVLENPETGFPHDVVEIPK